MTPSVQVVAMPTKCTAWDLTAFIRLRVALNNLSSAVTSTYMPLIGLGSAELGHACRRLVIKRAWPSCMRTLAGDHERFEQTYFATYPGFYFTGDGCRRDKDGYYWLTGMHACTLCQHCE